MELEQSIIYLANLEAELSVATEEDQIDIILHDIAVIKEHLKVIQSLPEPPEMTLTDNINFKYTVWLTSSIVGVGDHMIYVFTETDRVDEFKEAVYKMVSKAWIIKSYEISWQDAF